MIFDVIVGVDISKKTLDFCIQDDLSNPSFLCINNTSKAVEDHLTKTSCYKDRKVLFVMEYTGMYNQNLVSVMEKNNVNLVKSRKQIKALSNDYDFLNPDLINAEKGPINRALDSLKEQIDAIEEEIKMRILNDHTLSRLYILLLPTSLRK